MRLGDRSTHAEGTLVASVELGSDALDGHRTYWEQMARLAAEHDRDLPEAAPAALVERAVREIPDLAGRRGRLVELGPGRGGLLRALGDLRDEQGDTRYDVHGVDIADAMLERARATVDGMDNVHLHLGNGYDLGDFDDGSVDVVYAVQTFRYLPKRIAMNYLREIHRVLSLGGRAWLHLPSALRHESLLALHHVSQSYFALHPVPASFWGPFEAVAMLRFCGFWVWSVSDDLVAVAGKTGRPGGDAQLAGELAALAVRESGLPDPG